MATWVVGDVHGCADELRELVRQLGIERGGADRLVSVGDLLHRGPDPLGVVEVLRSVGAVFVLGNHERAVLRRAGLAPRLADGSDAPPRRDAFPALEPADLAGDGGEALHADPAGCADVLRFLQGHAGYYLRHGDVRGAGPLPDGRGWIVVHAGLDPSAPVEAASPRALTTLRRAPAGRRRWWYEDWRGPELVLFGHTHSAAPRAQRLAGRLVALGLDTGCVYGGRLTAYCPERDELASVPAARSYVGVPTR